MPAKLPTRPLHTLVDAIHAGSVIEHLLLRALLAGIRAILKRIEAIEAFSMRSSAAAVPLASASLLSMQLIASSLPCTPEAQLQ